MEVLVKNDAELKAAWPQVANGGTILLANDAKFAYVQLLQQFTAPVVVMPADPLGPKPEMSSVRFRGSKNLTMKGLRFFSPTNYTALEFRDACDGVTIEDCEINCGYALSGNPQMNSYRSGCRASGRNLAFKKCVFARTGTGIGAGSIIGLEISNCKFIETVQDCVNIGSNSQDILITDNEFNGQLEAADADHHYDMLQFWVQTDAVMDTKNVKILRNRFIAPNERVTPQSIFGRADYGTNPYKFQDVEIAYNMIYSRHANAIRMTEGDNIDVHHNVLTYAGVDPWTSKTVFLPGILVQKFTNSKIHHNVFPNKYGYPAIDTPEFYKNVVYKYPV